MVAPQDKHVLVVGIDGVRYDHLREMPTPVLDAVAAAGFLHPVQVHPKNVTISGPVWATVATGVHSDRHGILGNDEPSEAMAAHPDFLTLVRTADPGASTLAVANWPNLLEAEGCGPIFAGGGDQVRIPDVGHDLHLWELADDAATGAAARLLAGGDHRAAFVYLGGTDMYGHEIGAGAEYRASIERQDARLGVLLTAIASRPRRDQEEWTVLVVTDHGHLDEGGHGGDSPAERTAWMAGTGPGLADVRADVDHADIPAHVLAALGLSVPGWESAGRPLA